MKRYLIVIILLISIMGVKTSYASVLWYNGDLDIGGLSNEFNTLVSDSRVYEDFIVPSGGWTIDTIWSDNLMTFIGVTQTRWEIRSGISTGNGGTLITGGAASATQTATGRSSGNNIEYKIEVSGLNIFLSDGTYWLAVAPVGFGPDYGYHQSWISHTNGANAFGNPPGNNENAFWDSPYWTKNFEPAGIGNNYSMGIGGVLGNAVIPELTTMAFLEWGLIGLAGLVKLRKKASN